jgi:trimethylamine:corrinoid methyltransferase-like protein
MQGGRRAGNQQDFRNLVKLAQRYDIIHCTGGYPVEPVDLHASVRHLDCLSDIAKLTDKAFHAYSLGKERNQDALEMVRILVEGHEAVARTARRIFPMADKARDEPTADLLTQRLTVHEQTAWMLRSLLEE